LFTQEASKTKWYCPAAPFPGGSKAQIRQVVNTTFQPNPPPEIRAFGTKRRRSIKMRGISQLKGAI
jgi:hypothetical protein